MFQCQFLLWQLVMEMRKGLLRRYNIVTGVLCKACVETVDAPNVFVDILLYNYGEKKVYLYVSYFLSAFVIPSV